MTKTILTVDGEIKASIIFNSFFQEFQLDVDGEILASSKNKEYIEREFNNMSNDDQSFVQEKLRLK